MGRQQKKLDISSSQDQQREKGKLPPVPAKKRKIAAQKEPESAERASALRHVDVEAEKHAAKASGKQVQRGQGRITNPKTNESNQYR